MLEFCRSSGLEFLFIAFVTCSSCAVCNHSCRYVNAYFSYNSLKRRTDARRSCKLRANFHRLPPCLSLSSHRFRPLPSMSVISSLAHTWITLPGRRTSNAEMFAPLEVLGQYFELAAPCSHALSREGNLLQSYLT